MLTHPARLSAAICLVAAGAVGAMLARPDRYEVEGLSMAPGLLPGDVVATEPLVSLTRGREPRRFERWILSAPDGRAAIKRVVGLPGETVAMRDGDLAIEGRVVLTPPPILAQTASVVPGSGSPEDATPGDRQCRRVVMPAAVFDDASFAATERRRLLPVRDAGVAATIRCHESGRGPCRLRARVGTFVIAWRLPSAGSFAVVTGRLDGHLVAACWTCDSPPPPPAHARSCLPSGIPAAWQVVRSWPADTLAADDDTAAPALAVWIEGDGTTDGCCDRASGEIERFIVWRDLLHRPAADGRAEWRLGPDEFFVLGDFPSGSRDSRHWGPLQRRRLRSPVSAAR